LTRSRVRPAHDARVEFDAEARRLITAAADGGIDIAYRHGTGLVLDVHPRACAGHVMRVRGAGGTLSVDNMAVPYAVAAVLLAIRDATGLLPRCRFPWPADHRMSVIFGLTGLPAQVRQVLRRSEPDPGGRPVVQVSD
jgi:hypothetical protein